MRNAAATNDAAPIAGWQKCSGLVECCTPVYETVSGCCVGAWTHIGPCLGSAGEMCYSFFDCVKETATDAI